jgi:hypothetical protein
MKSKAIKKTTLRRPRRSLLLILSPQLPTKLIPHTIKVLVRLVLVGTSHRKRSPSRLSPRALIQLHVLHLVGRPFDLLPDAHALVVAAVAGVCEAGFDGLFDGEAAVDPAVGRCAGGEGDGEGLGVEVLSGAGPAAVEVCLVVPGLARIRGSNVLEKRCAWRPCSHGFVCHQKKKKWKKKNHHRCS